MRFSENHPWRDGDPPDKVWTGTCGDRSAGEFALHARGLSCVSATHGPFCMSRRANILSNYVALSFVFRFLIGSHNNTRCTGSI
jgi:hypothetical protein